MPDHLEEQLENLGAEWERLVPSSLRASVRAMPRDVADMRHADVMPSRAWWAYRRFAWATAAVVVLLIVMPGSRGVIGRQAYRLLQAFRIAPST